MNRQEKQELKKFEEFRKELKEDIKQEIISTFVRYGYLLYKSDMRYTGQPVNQRVIGLTSKDSEKFLNELINNIYKVYIED